MAYVADNALGLHAFDVSVPADLGFLDSYDTSGIAYGVALAGDVAYVADQASGLHAFDISDPSDLGLLDTYDTAGVALGVAVERKSRALQTATQGWLRSTSPTRPTSV